MPSFSSRWMSEVMTIAYMAGGLLEWCPPECRVCFRRSWESSRDDFLER